MLNLNFAQNLEKLADDMISQIESTWQTPFGAPIVIFPDPKLEQWFRLRWVQRKGVLANLNKSTIDRFLFQILVGDNKNKKKLTSDMLSNVMISYLTQKEGDIFNYQSLDESVKSYLEVEGKLDENRLFDFANTMAGLFLEYETSRPSGFVTDLNFEGKANGILDCWKQGDLKDFFISRDGKAAANENWQKKLYSALFHKNGSKDSLLTQTFENLNKKKSEEVIYLTLPYLYESCRNSDGQVEFKYQGDSPVFIFGLSGMGQFYRVILQEFAKDHEVYAYIQNPCMEFWEDCNGNPLSAERLRLTLPTLDTDPSDETEVIDDNENELLRYWGKAGRDNIKLWCESANYDFNTKDESKDGIPTDSLLHRIQHAIAHRSNSIESIDDETLKVTTAPSKLREIEGLHTEICKLIKDKKAQINDILVVSPNIDSYRTSIFRVFDNLPFSILDSAAKDALTTQGISLLFAIREKGVLSRPDFFALARNPVVQAARGIDPDEVSNWESWISNMGIYRDRFIENGDSKERKESWTTAVKRLLLARLSYDSISNGSCTFEPYSDMESSNNNSLCRFVDAIESLENWIDKEEWKKVHHSEHVQSESLPEIYEFLDSWLLMKNPPKNLISESIIYQSVAKSKDYLLYQYSAGSDTISFRILSQTIENAAQGSKYSCGNLFVNGITFMNFAPNRIIPTKYLFFIGADAINFPGTPSTNTLDLRKCVRPWPGDDSPVSKNRYAFLCQLMSTSEGFYLSYVNKDLQKDEDFYPSSVISDLRGFLKNATGNNHLLEDYNLPLDETRLWKDIFTPRALRNKKITIGFTRDKKEIHEFKPNDNSKSKAKPIEKITIYQIKQFLKDPFEFRVNHIMNLDSDEKDPEKEAFEPITMGKLQESRLTKILLANQLGISQGLIAEKDDLESNDEIKTYALNQGLIPNEIFSKKIWESLKNKAKFIGECIKEHFSEDSGYHYSKDSVEAQIDDWTLTGISSIRAENENQIHLFEVVCNPEKNGNPIKKEKFLSIYIQALGLISKGGHESIAIHCYTLKDSDPKASTSKEFIDENGKKAYVYWADISLCLTQNEAKDALRNIFKEMFNTDTQGNHHKVVPFSLVEKPEGISKENHFRYDKYLDKFKEGSYSNPWQYFAGKDLFDIRQVCGFDYKNFDAKWNDAMEYLKKLTPGLWKPDDSSDESGTKKNETTTAIKAKDLK